MTRPPPKSSLFPSTPLFRSDQVLQRPPLLFHARQRVAQLGQLHRRRSESDRGRGASPGPHGGRTRHRIRRHRSEEHTSELQSPCNLVCRLLLEKKKHFDPTSALDSFTPTTACLSTTSLCFHAARTTTCPCSSAGST